MLPYVLYYDQHTSLQPTDSQLRYMYKFTYHLLPSSSNGLHNLLDPRLFHHDLCHLSDVNTNELKIKLVPPPPRFEESTHIPLTYVERIFPNMAADFRL